MHLPLRYPDKRDSVDDAIVVDTYTSTVMAMFVRRAENDSRKFVPAHSTGSSDGTRALRTR